MFKKTDFNYKNLNPFRQGILIFLLITIASAACLIAGEKNIQTWNIIIAPIFLYCFYNPIIGVFHQKPLQYSSISIIIFGILLYYIYISGNAISVLSFNNTNELRRFSMLIILFYILFNLLCLVFRGVLHMLREIDN